MLNYYQSIIMLNRTVLLCHFIEFDWRNSCLVTHKELYIASKILELWLQWRWNISDGLGAWHSRCQQTSRNGDRSISLLWTFHILCFFSIPQTLYTWVKNIKTITTKSTGLRVDWTRRLFSVVLYFKARSIWDAERCLHGLTFE